MSSSNPEKACLRRWPHRLAVTLSCFLLLLIAGLEPAFAKFATAQPYLQVEPTSVSLEPGQKVLLFATVNLKSSRSEEILSWSADAGEVLVVDQPTYPAFRGAGWYTAPSLPGLYTLKISSSLYPQHYVEVPMTVLNQGQAAVVLESEPSILFEHAGETSQIEARILTSGPFTGAEKFQFESSNPAIVSVNNQGKLVAHEGPGAALITVSAEGAEPAYVTATIGSLWETTLVLHADDIRYLAGDHALLRGGINGLQVGRILISGVPGGLLARVTGIQPVGQDVRVTLEPAGLPDAYRRLKFELQSPPVDVVLNAETSLGRTANKAGPQVICEEQGPHVTPNIDLGTTEYRANLSFNFTYELDEEGVPSFALFTTGEANVSMSGMSMGLDLVGGVSLDCYIEASAIPVPVIPGPIAVGATITPALGFDIGMEATTTVTFNAPVLTREIRDLRQGFGYDGRGFFRISSRQDSGLMATFEEPLVELDGEIGAEVRAYGRGTLGLGVVAGGFDISLDILELRIFGYAGVSIAAPLHPSAFPNIKVVRVPRHRAMEVRQMATNKCHINAVWTDGQL